MESNPTPAERYGCDEALGAANRELNCIRGTAFGPLAGPGADWARDRLHEVMALFGKEAR